MKIYINPYAGKDPAKAISADPKALQPFLQDAFRGLGVEVSGGRLVGRTPVFFEYDVSGDSPDIAAKVAAALNAGKLNPAFSKQAAVYINREPTPIIAITTASQIKETQQSGWQLVPAA